MIRGLLSLVFIIGGVIFLAVGGSGVGGGANCPAPVIGTGSYCLIVPFMTVDNSNAPVPATIVLAAPQKTITTNGSGTASISILFTSNLGGFSINYSATTLAYLGVSGRFAVPSNFNNGTVIPQVTVQFTIAKANGILFTVVDKAGLPVSGITASVTGDGSCTTDATGTCLLNEAPGTYSWSCYTTGTITVLLGQIAHVFVRIPFVLSLASTSTTSPSGRLDLLGVGSTNEIIIGIASIFIGVVIRPKHSS